MREIISNRILDDLSDTAERDTQHSDYIYITDENGNDLPTEAQIEVEAGEAEEEKDNDDESGTDEIDGVEDNESETDEADEAIIQNPQPTPRPTPPPPVGDLSDAFNPEDQQSLPADSAPLLTATAPTTPDSPTKTLTPEATTKQTRFSMAKILEYLSNFFKGAPISN